MRKTARTVFYFFSILFLLTLSFYGGKHHADILRYVGVQNVEAQDLGDPNSDVSRFARLMEVLRYLRQNYVEEIKEEKYTELVYGSIRGMLRSLDDRYTRFMDPEAYKNMKIDTKGQFGGVGISIGIARTSGQLMVMSPIEGTPAHRVGLKAGDIIMKIDGVSTVDMALDDAVARIRGEPGTPVVLTIWRPGLEDEGRDFTIVRDVIELKTVQKSKVLDGDIGYVYIEAFSQQTPEVLKKDLLDLKRKRVKGLILDLRGNPGGPLDAAVEVANLFMDEGPIVHRVSRNRRKKTYYAAPEKKVFGGAPMAVLVDNGSASASEIVTGALQDNGIAAVIGEKTFGKGLVQTIYPLSDESAVLITTDKYYTSKMKDINEKGIVPDVIVKADVRTGRTVETSKDEREMERESRIEKFPLEALKERISKDKSLSDAGVLVFDHQPRTDMFFYRFGGENYLRAEDLGPLFGVGVKWDEKTNVMNIEPGEISTDESERELKDAQLQRAVKYIREKLGKVAVETTAQPSAGR
ncbi:MAG: S41 family peptidase [bacterium]